MSFYNISTIIIAIFLAFMFTQKKNDERKLKEIAERLITMIQQLIGDERFYKIKSKEDINFIRIQIRTVSNKIACLEGIEQKLYIKDEIVYIKKIFNDYEEIFGAYINDSDCLEKSENIFLNKILLIQSKCDSIIVKLYKC